MDDQNSFEEYYKRKNQVFIIQLAAVAFFLFLMTSCFAIPLRNVLADITENTILLITLYFYIVYVLYFVFTFGLRYYGEFVLERKFGISVLEFKEWVKKILLRECWISFLVLTIIQTIYFFMGKSLLWWWAYAAVCWIIFEIILNPVLPVYLQPLFYKPVPLEDKALKQNLIDLAKTLRINLKHIFVVSSEEEIKNHLVLTGIEPKRRLFLTDDLLDYSKEELDIVIVLELARNYYGHVWKAAIARAVAALVICAFCGLSLAPLSNFFGFKPMTDISSLTLFLGLFLAASSIIAPLKNAFLRRMEKEADNLVLRLTELPDAFISVMIRFDQESNRDPEPARFVEWMLYEHVPLSQRIDYARDFAHDLLLRQTQRKF